MNKKDYGNDGLWKTLRVYPQSFHNSDGVTNIPTIPATTNYHHLRGIEYGFENDKQPSTRGVNFAQSKGVNFGLSLRGSS